MVTGEQDHVAPATATVVHHPGCSSFVQAAAVFRQTCTGPTLQHSTLSTFWLSQLGFRRGRVVRLGDVESNPFGPTGTSHVAIGLGPGADMPTLVRTGNGIRMAVHTESVPFMGGSAVLPATGKPHVSPGHACVWERHTHRFTNLRYQGTLTPAASPLAVRFDTGALTFRPVHATLAVPRYLKRQPGPVLEPDCRVAGRRPATGGTLGGGWPRQIRIPAPRPSRRPD